jgi:hypothetical protein
MATITLERVSKVYPGGGWKVPRSRLLTMWRQNAS